MLEAFAVTLGALIVMQLAPGPNLVAVASAALGTGRRAALMVVAGIASGACFWVLAVAAGLGALLEAYPVLITAMKLGGGAYLLWIGFTGLRAAWRGNEVRIEAVADDKDRVGTDLSQIRRGLLVVATNPKVALGWAAIASFLFGSGLSAWEVASFAPFAAASAATVYGGYGILFSTGSVARLYRRCWRALDALFGATFGALGAKLMLDGAEELQP